MRKPLLGVLLAAVLVGLLHVPASAQLGPAESLTLLNVPLSVTVTAQITSTIAARVGRVESLGLHAIFTRAGGGTTAKAWIQTSFDNGTSWFDIANFAFTTATAQRLFNLTNDSVTSIATPGDGALADNTAVNGFLGPIFRVKYSTTGTYTGASSFQIFAVPK